MRCGLLGERLGHSRSPEIHKMLCDYSYELFEISPERLGDFFETTAFDGINVTIPYKKAVIPYCAKLSKIAKEIGSVNTIVRCEDGSLYGDNTDAAGFEAMIACEKNPRGKKVLVLGSGGAAVTVCYVLRQKGADVRVISRQGEDNYDHLEQHADAQWIVNTTPLGMYPNTGVAPISLRMFPNCEAVFDLIYNPYRTQLLLDAEERGIFSKNGWTMLVEQAACVAERFTGSHISQERRKVILAEMQKANQNIVLIGMPGSGKSSIGEAVSSLMGRRFVDTDEVLRVRYGSIPKIFAEQGEEAFRKMEHTVLREVSRETGIVLATGGGCITRSENIGLLRQNGVVVFLERPICELAQEGRPLSIDLPRMYETRLPLYQRAADFTITNNASPLSVATQIKEVYDENFGD
ncbi:MAG: shikimate kinase [Evtepia sp.]